LPRQEVEPKLIKKEQNNPKTDSVNLTQSSNRVGKHFIFES